MIKLPEGLPTPDWRDEEYGIALYCGDCLDVMPMLPAGCVDMVCTDPPYGTTTCKWDSVIPLEPMWAGLKHAAKDNCAIVLTASQPFTTTLIASNMAMFKYCWVWDKAIIANPFLAKYQPLKQHEDVVVFGGNIYYPIMEKRHKQRLYKDKYGGGKSFNKKGTGEKQYMLDSFFPKSIVRISNADQQGKDHPTQKPVELMEYMIKTYTNPCETVLDFTLGSGTTGVAAVRLDRAFIGIEKEPKYFEIAVERIRQAIIDKQGGELFATHDPEQLEITE